jgi:type II secretory ATPase GspE/PulE/Tfp pilus assembly ATPase PilB-like protein
VLIGYILVRVIQVEQRYVTMRSAVAREAAEARDETDERVIENLQNRARELGLPQRAQAIHVDRGRDSILISMRWSDTLSFSKLSWIRQRAIDSKTRIW